MIYYYNIIINIYLFIIIYLFTISGSFFKTYPRHETLISINKRHTGETNKEFNFRHDWNSLISDDESLLFTKYSDKYFPEKDKYVKYLADYTEKLGIKVQYNTTISNIGYAKGEGDEKMPSMQDQHGNIYTCKYVNYDTWVLNKYL